MINPEGQQSTFWRICDDEGNCHCDWRLTLGDCYEDTPMRIIYIINAIGSAIVTVIGRYSSPSSFIYYGLKYSTQHVDKSTCALLFYRIYYRKQQIFDCRTPTGFVRPKPIEAMLFMAAIFNFLRMLQAIIVVTDAAPNPAFRSFLYEIPWQFGLGAFSCYVFGIAHTVADSSKSLYNAWFRSPVRIDILGTAFICAPFISNNICSIAAGIFALRGEDFLASQFTHALYYLWTVYCFSLGFMVLIAGLRLLRLLNHHLRMQHDLRVNIAKIKSGTFKVKAIMLVGVVCLWVFAFILCMYGVFRDPVTRNTGLNLAISAVWTYDGLAATLLVELALILNPRMTASLGVSNMSGNGSSTGQPTSNSLTTSDGRNVTSMDTTHSKWEKFGTVSRGSMGHTQQTVSNGGFSTGGFGANTGNDGLPRYSISDMSMDILKGHGGGPNSNASFYTAGDLSRPSSPPTSNAPSYGMTGIGEIEQDRMNYNATTGQVRTPPRYVIPAIDEQRQLDMDSFSTLGGNNSVMSSSHLMGHYSPPSTYQHL
ncbi:hypothetical protein BDA99DRAFT_560685 [Phascolomyces articulosus]|uniref:Uncharacterized protein n=1 Tax=Phascolomyces articulosus TaxID=60185 RepID=A0AAD5PCU0_9FUNG|nr:hypothetical protein BDA99DRAFT_560685 [Phascolomyces articulosus]